MLVLFPILGTGHGLRSKRTLMLDTKDKENGGRKISHYIL